MTQIQPKIVSGPVPDEFGNAIFVIVLGDRCVQGIAHPSGSGVYETDTDVAGPVMRAISDFGRRNPELVLSCLRESAMLRRAAGHETGLAVSVAPNITVKPEPVIHEDHVVFTAYIGSSPVGVLVSRGGAIVNDYDPVNQSSEELEPEALVGAERAVLDFVLTHPERARIWGLDCELLDLLWN